MNSVFSDFFIFFKTSYQNVFNFKTVKTTYPKIKWSKKTQNLFFHKKEKTVDENYTKKF